MGRKRSRFHDLPPRMRAKELAQGTSYYYVSNGNWEPLGKDLDKARRKWADLEAGGAAQGQTVAELCQRYIDREVRAENTIAMYRSYVKAIAKDFPIPAAQLTSRHVALWRELNGKRRAYANGVISVITAAFKIGQELGVSNLIVVEKWKSNVRDYELTPAKFIRIRDNAIDWLRIGMDIAYLTGARPVDVRNLTWAKVNADGVLVRQKKTLKRQEFAINEALASVLAKARQRPVLGLYVVATKTGRNVSREMWDDQWHLACKAAGVEGAQTRDIRAMAAKAAKEDGQDFQALLGHTTRSMSERYIKGKQTETVEPLRKTL